MNISGQALGDAGGLGNQFFGGAWNVNVAGSGRSNQTATAASGGIPTWVIVAACAGAAWLLLKR